MKFKWISFKKWSSKATKRLVRHRIYRKGKWTPFTNVVRRYEKTEIKIKIRWDYPIDQEDWLNPENIKLALSTFCPNTQFEVSELSFRNIFKKKGGELIG